MDKISNRIIYFDYIRVIAIIFVIGIHNMGALMSSNKGTLTHLYKITLDSIFSIAVPLFVMISGALLLGKNISIEKLFKRRFPRILVPFLFWSAIVYSIYYILGEKKSPINFFTDLLEGNIHGVYWYIYMLIGIYLSIPIIDKLIVSKDKKAIEYFLIMWLISIFLSLFYPPFKIDLSFWGYFLGYFIIGYYLSNYIKFKKTKILWIIFIISILVQIFIRTNYDVQYSKIVIWLTTLSIFLIIKNMSLKPNKVISFISNYSYGIYLSHILFISFLVKLGVDATYLGSYITVPILIFIDLVGSISILWVLNKIPFLKKTTGIQ